MFLSSLIFFFFQAEDGIRDGTVTGVQTCALPIFDRIMAEVGQFKQVKIDLDDAGRERLLQAALGLTLGEAENVFAKIIVKEERLSGDDVNEVFAEKQQIIRKSGLLEYCATNENFAHVGGMAVLKDWLNKRSAAFS